MELYNDEYNIINDIENIKFEPPKLTRQNAFIFRTYNNYLLTNDLLTNDLEFNNNNNNVYRSIPIFNNLPVIKLSNSFDYNDCKNYSIQSPNLKRNKTF